MSYDLLLRNRHDASFAALYFSANCWGMKSIVISLEEMALRRKNVLQFISQRQLMNLAVKTDESRYKKGSIRNAVSFALSSAATHARQRYEHYLGMCKKFEKKYKLTSLKFMEQFDAGNLGDDQEFFDWYAATRGLNLWRERYEILSGVSV